MKKHYYGILALAFTLSIPAISLAQYGNPGDAGGSSNNIPAAISDQIRAGYQARMQNVENNQNYRNDMLEGRSGSTTPPWTGSSTPSLPPPWNATGTPPWRDGSTTAPWTGSSTMPRDLRGMPPRGDAGALMPWNTSSTMMFLGAFRMRRDDIAEQFQTALDNLTEIRGRIDTRIQTEQQDGIDMSAAISLLATADSDIASATSAVNDLASYMPAASSTISASTTVDLGTARDLARTAQIGIEQAQRALSDVVGAIAHAMGYDLEQGFATSTSSTTTQY